MAGNGGLETEIKILNIDKGELVKRLEYFLAKKEWAGMIEAVYLDTPELGLKKQGKVLRIRKAYGKVEVAVKEKADEDEGDYKTRKEYQVDVDDFETAISIFGGLGFTCETFRYRKKRTTYSLGRAKVEIDEIKGVPAFAEIEGSKQAIEGAITMLGLSGCERSRLSVIEIMRMHGRA